MHKKLAVIWDLDGVLANSDHRLHYIVSDRANPDWDSYHKETLDDRPIKSGLALFWALDFFGSYCQFICTARPESNRELTEMWLKRSYLGTYQKLLMRKEGDERSGSDVKLDMLRQIRNEGYDVIMAFEDHPEIVSMYRMSNVPCFAADDRHWHEASVQNIAATCKGMK